MLLAFTILHIAAAPRIIGGSVCKASYGTGIDHGDCEEIFKDFHRHLIQVKRKVNAKTPIQLATQDDGNERKAEYCAFSRNSDLVGKWYTMLVGFSWKTCSIGIDLTDPPPDF